MKGVVLFMDNTFYLLENSKKYGMTINSDARRVDTVLMKLQDNKIKYGKTYCPCMPNHNEDTICPCKYMRRYKVCRCGLYVKGE